MDSVFRAVVVYAFLLLVLRLSGKRTLAQVTPFNFVLLLIISETTQEALIDGDHSMTNAAILITTLVGLNIFMSELKQRFKAMERLLEGVPLLIIADGQLEQDRMNKERVDMDDILEAARESQGIESLDQIKYAVIERSGNISIIPRDKSNSAP
jgi:uncharacterized membrane protein YcaP (DUF421 family)